MTQTRSILAWCRAALALAPVLLAGAACGDAGAPERAAVHGRDTAARVETRATVLDRDSVLHVFRISLPRVDRLTDGAPSRDSLVGAIMGALARHDTAALVRLHVTRAEYAWLLYPESRFSRPPYSQPVDVAWALALAQSEKGLNRLVSRRAGPGVRFAGYDCPRPVEREGRNAFHGCRVRVQDEDDVLRQETLFRALVERDGVWKVASWANQF